MTSTSTPERTVDFAALAAKLDPDELAALVEVIGQAPGEREHWQRHTRAAVRSAAWDARLQGQREGAVRAIEQLKRAQRGVVDDLALYRHRYHLMCPDCARNGASRDWKTRALSCPPDPYGMCSCPRCENRTQETWAQPAAWDEYRGGPVDPW